MIKDKTLKRSMAEKWRKISNEPGGFPVVKYHCDILAVGTLKRP